MADIGNIKNFFVTWFDASASPPYSVSEDITDDVMAVSFTDTGSGHVNECILKLSAVFGNYISDDTTSGKPVIDQYDRFKVEAEDLSGNTFSRYFEFNPLVVPSETKTEGTLLELNLIGIEYHTQRISFSGRFWFANAFDVAQEIGQSYNENTNLILNNIQPVLTRHDADYSQVLGTGNGFPKYTVNHYEYGLVEDSGYNRWQQMLDKLGGSVSNGGVLDYFDCGFETSDVSAIEIALFSQGSRTVDITDDANIPTIAQSIAVNVGSTDVGIAAATATQVAAWGSQTHGSLPTGHSKYVSGVDQFIFRPLWDANIPYKEDSLVKYIDNKHYIALNDITSFPAPPPPNADWEQIDMSDEFGDSIQYSKWTDNKVREWVNCGANPSQVNQVDSVVTPDLTDGKVGASMFDINIVVLDNRSGASFFRTWADFRLSDGGGRVASITVTDPGSGYTTVPNVTITGGGGGASGATATAELDIDGTIPVITLTSGGTGYTSNPTVTVDPPGAGTTATATALISTGEDISIAADNWAYSGQDNQFPIGRRMLVDGLATGFTGSDPNGIPYQNNVSEWDGENWIVKYRPADTGTDLENMQIVIIDEGLIYQWDTSSYPNQWSIVTGDLAVDCLHQYTSISSVESFDPKPTETDDVNHPDVTKDGGTFATNIDSAIEFNFEVGDNYLDRLLSGSGTPNGDFFKRGSWAVFRIPFSPNNYGGGITIGNEFGKELGTEPDVGINRFQPAFLDTQNMTWTSRGTRGFVQDDSEDLGQLQEVAAIIKTTNQRVDGGKLDGPLTVRIWMIDRYDNTVFYDIEIPFVDVFFPVKIPFSSFKIYRGNKPRFFDLQLNNIANLLIPQELELYNRFAFREIQMVGFQIQDFYDEFGRYAPDISGDGLDFNVDQVSLSKLIGGRLALTIDDFHFTKPLLAISKIDTDRNLETQFKKRPHIMTYKQLQNDSATELQKEQFQLRQYDIETAGETMFDLKFGDSFFYQNPRLVNLEDDTTEPGVKKIKLVAKNIQYNFTAPGTGEGGLTRTISSVKRFFADG